MSSVPSQGAMIANQSYPQLSEQAVGTAEATMCEVHHIRYTTRHITAEHKIAQDWPRLTIGASVP
jgi:hypothetical protein